MDTEDRNSHHPLLPGKSGQGSLGERVWCGVTEESLSINNGENHELNHGRPPSGLDRAAVVERF